MGNANINFQKLEYDNARTKVGQLNYADDQPIKTNRAQRQIPAVDLENSLKLSLRLNRKTIQLNSFYERTFHMLASLKAKSLPTSKKPNVDLVCVLDHSGSMEGQKINLVRNTFNYLFHYLSNDDRLSIVIFDDKAYRLIPLLRMTPANKTKIIAAINNVNVNIEGGTDIELGMAHAFDILKQRRYKNPVTSIFLLSDGLDSKAQERVQKTMNEFNIPEDIIINTFGFGNDHDPQLMSDIASLRDGNFYFIKEYDMIDEVFVDCLGGLLSSICRKAEIRIKPEQSKILEGVNIPKAYGDLTMWTKNNDTYITKMMHLLSGRTKNFVLDLQLPTAKIELLNQDKKVRIASAEAQITALDGRVFTKTTDLYVTLVDETEEFNEDDEEEDREVMKNFYRVQGAVLLDEVRKLADQKKNDDAKKILQNFKEELANSFLKRQEFIVNLIKDIEKAIQNLNPVVYETHGKRHLIANQKAQMWERSNIESENCYQNEMQCKMIESTRKMKSTKMKSKW